MKRIERRFLIFATVLSLYAIAPNVNAAQDGAVTAEHANVHTLPDPNSPVLETHAKGDKVRMSSGTRDGWYKVLTTAHQFGWILQTEVSPWTLGRELTDNQLETKDRGKVESHSDDDPWLFIRVVGSGVGLFGSDLSGPLSLSSTYYMIGYGGFGEVGFRIMDRARILVRAGYYMGSSGTDISAGGGTYSVQQDDMPLLLGAAIDFIKSPSWSVGVAVYGGVSIQNDMTVTSTSNPFPNSFTLTDYNSPAFMMNLYAKWKVSRGFGFVLELGGIFDQSTPQQVTAIFNGAAPFGGSTSLTTLRNRNIGPVASLGVEFAF